MKVVDSGAWTDVVEADSNEIKFISDFLSVTDSHARYSSAYKRGTWDGKVKFYDRKNNRFPSGLLQLVQKKFSSSSFTLTVEQSLRSDCLVDFNWSSKLLELSPRPHQRRAVNDALKAKRGVIEVPTGGGKTLILSGICKALSGKILVIVPTKSLLFQTGNDIKKFLSEDVGYIGDGNFDTDKRITIGIVKSLLKLEKESRDSYDAVVVDEAHHTSAKTYKTFLMSLSCRYRLGLSADSFDKHKTRASSNVKKYSVCAVLGPKIHCTENKELLDKGILAKPTITFEKIKVPGTEDYESMPYDEAYCNLVCQNNNLIQKCVDIAKKSVGGSKSVLILIKHIHQGELIEAALVSHGVNHRFLHGSTNAAILKEEITNFKNDKYPVLIGSNIFTEGVDFPSIDVLILAAGDVSPTKQRLGRGLRAKHNKENIVEVYDFVPQGNKYMKTHAKKRAKIYIEEGHKVVLK